MSRSTAEIVTDISGLNLLSKSLVSQDLLLLKDFLSEADFKFNNGLLVYNALLGSAVVDKELLVVYQNSLSLLHEAHKATEEVRVQIGVL